MTSTPADINRLVAEIEVALAAKGNDEGKLRRALSLAGEAARSPAGTHRDELIRDARQLLKQGRK